MKELAKAALGGRYIMEPEVAAVLANYEQRSREEDQLAENIGPQEFDRRRDEFLLPVGPETGWLLNLFARRASARTIVEVGTSYGYSTVWLADAARQTGGKVITIEIDDKKRRHAMEQSAYAGLDQFVDFRLGDALEILAGLTLGIDFVLLDLWKDLYIPCFDLIYPRLTPGAMVFADNMTHPASAQAEAEAYRWHVRTHRTMDHITMPQGNGVEYSRMVRR